MVLVLVTGVRRARDTYLAPLTLVISFFSFSKLAIVLSPKKAMIVICSGQKKHIINHERSTNSYSTTHQRFKRTGQPYTSPDSEPKKVSTIKIALNLSHIKPFLPTKPHPVTMHCTTKITKIANLIRHSLPHPLFQSPTMDAPSL